MSIVIPEHLLAFEASADEKIAFAKKSPMAGGFERKLVTIAIILRKLESDGTQSANERYRDAIKVVLLKAGYTYASIQKAFYYILEKAKAISYAEELSEYTDAIAMLQKADAPAPVVADAPAKTKSTTPFLGSFVALAFAFSLSIVGCYIQPSGLSVRAYESKLNTSSASTADAKCDKHQQHFELLQSRLKHGHSDALFFIKDYSKTAEQLGRAYDISPEIILAVGILESSSGTSNISVCSRNFHGIKAGDHWQGLTFTCENKKVWRAWNSNADGFEGFCQYICERMPHFVGKNITPAEFAAAYGSSDPKRYAEQLHLIITRYGLKTLFS
jgi:flagellum-specific peptidoglycan hydrolase FlgJ